MQERKSSRARKVVDYCKFGGDGDIDDDFADCTPPPSKKQKLSNKENKLKKQDKSSSATKVSKHKSESRKSREEKLFEREIQHALELSLSQSDPSQESTIAGDNSHNEAAVSGVPPVIQIGDSPSPSPVLPILDNPPVLQKIDVASVPQKSKNSKIDYDDDEIIVLESGIEEIPSSRRRTSKQKNYVDSDSEAGNDFEIDLRKFLKSPLTPKSTRSRRKRADSDTDFAVEDDEGDSCDDDDNDDDDYNGEDSDSDFGSSKKKKPTKSAKTKSAPTKPAPKKATTTVKKNTAATVSKPSKPAPLVSTKPCNKGPLATSSPVAPKPAPSSVKTPGSVATSGRLQQSWKPPALAAENKSPAVGSKSRSSIGGNNIGKSPTVAGVAVKSPNPGLSGVSIKSPSMSLGGIKLTSPSSGLRVGLSRNMKLKSLHPNLKLQN